MTESSISFITFVNIMQKMWMTVLVSSPDQVAENIHRYNERAARFASLMPYNRAWYALRTNGGWLLGPSKFVGYQGMSPDEYLGSEYNAARHGRVMRRDPVITLDGRVTEGVLRRWSEPIEEGHPEYEKLHRALDEFCARYGKRPNNLARISVLRLQEASAASITFSDEIVALMASVFRGLTPAQKSEFRRQIASS